MNPCSDCAYYEIERETGAPICNADLNPNEDDTCEKHITDQDVLDQKAEDKYNHKADLRRE